MTQRYGLQAEVSVNRAAKILLKWDLEKLPARIVVGGIVTSEN